MLLVVSPLLSMGNTFATNISPSVPPSLQPNNKDSTYFTPTEVPSQDISNLNPEATKPNSPQLTSRLPNQSPFPLSIGDDNTSLNLGNQKKDYFQDTMESLMQDIKIQAPTTINGGKVVMNSPLSQFFQAIHTLHVTPNKGTYSYGITYVGTNKFNDLEYYPVLLGEIDTTASLKAIAIHKPMTNLRVRADIQTKGSEFHVVQTAAEYFGKDYSAVATVANPSFSPISGIISLQYLQRVTDRLSLGADFNFQKMFQMSGATVGGFLQYKTPLWQCLAKIGVGNWLLAYHRKISENFNLVAELEKTPMDESSLSTLCFNCTIPKTDFKISSSVNSQWVVSSVVEKRLSPLPASLSLSSSLNFANNKSKFGIGFTLGI